MPKKEEMKSAEQVKSEALEMVNNMKIIAEGIAKRFEEAAELISGLEGEDLEKTKDYLEKAFDKKQGKYAEFDNSYNNANKLEGRITELHGDIMQKLRKES